MQEKKTDSAWKKKKNACHENKVRWKEYKDLINRLKPH